MINEKAILELWHWLDQVEGQDDLPFWQQSTWTSLDPIDFPAENDDEKREYLAMAQEEDNFCGTSFCCAGFVLRKDLIIDADGDIMPPSRVTDPDGNTHEVRWWSDAGARALGINDIEAAELFDGNNTKPMIREILNRLLADHGSAITL